ncbi:MAG TPA: archease [Alphaproteobacteria bacterium]
MASLSTQDAAGWEHFPHGADIGVRGFGPSKEAAFEQAALALSAALTDPETIAPRSPVKIACHAPDDELLLTEWLNALIYEMATRKMLFARFKVQIREHALAGEAGGEPIDRGRHAPAAEAKGATFTALKVAQEGGRWVAQCVIDV